MGLIFLRVFFLSQWIPPWLLFLGVFIRFVLSECLTWICVYEIPLHAYGLLFLMALSGLVVSECAAWFCFAVSEFGAWFCCF